MGYVAADGGDTLQEGAGAPSTEAPSTDMNSILDIHAEHTRADATPVERETETEKYLAHEQSDMIVAISTVKGGTRDQNIELNTLVLWCLFFTSGNGHECSSM